jgi:hypothetical protein
LLSKNIKTKTYRTITLKGEVYAAGFWQENQMEREDAEIDGRTILK